MLALKKKPFLKEVSQKECFNIKKFARMPFLALEQMHQLSGKGFLHFRGACAVLGDPGAAGCSGNRGYPNTPNSLMAKLAV